MSHFQIVNELKFVFPDSKNRNKRYLRHRRGVYFVKTVKLLKGSVNIMSYRSFTKSGLN